MKIIVKVNPQCAILPKFTTRPRRKDDDESIINVDEIPSECDYVYEQYGEKYGFSSRMMLEYLQKGKIPVVVVNDVDVIELLQKKFGTSMKSYFIHREKPSRAKLIEIYNRTRGTANPEEIERRYQVAQKIYSMYIHKVMLFDNVILNTAEGFDEVTQIVKQIFDFSSIQKRLVKPEGNKIFVIAGNSGSGKDILIKGANRLGCLQVPKHTDREKNPTDGSEMIFQGDPRYNLTNCKLRYENFGNEYGIDVLPIWENLMMTDKHQMLISSKIKTLRELKAEFGEAVTSIYVHSDMNVEEYLKMEQQNGSSESYMQSRANQFNEAHKNYAEHFMEYDKSFIYTGSEKELMMQLAGVLGILYNKVNEQKKGMMRG